MERYVEELRLHLDDGDANCLEKNLLSRLRYEEKRTTSRATNVAYAHVFYIQELIVYSTHLPFRSL